MCVREGVRLFTAGHNHQVSITSCPRYYARPVGVAVMCEANHGDTQRGSGPPECGNFFFVIFFFKPLL